jgi:type VI secretion system secreted protein Hcp
MAVNAYLLIDGRPGSSTSKQGAIDIISFSFGASQQSVIGPGSSGAETRAGRASMGDIQIIKVVDKVSPLLFDDCVSGNILATVDIIYDKPLGDSQEDYYKIHLVNALITGFQNSGSSENPTEAISFAYSKIKVSYNPEQDGKLQGFVDKGFDVLKLKPW